MSQKEETIDLDFEELMKNVLSAIPPLVKSSNRLPRSGDEYEFYRTFPGFTNFVNFNKQEILTTIGTLLKNQGLKELFTAMARKSEVDIDELTDNLISCNDGILERCSTTIEYIKNGGNEDSKAPLPTAESLKAMVSSWNKTDRHGNEKKYTLYHKRSTVRPQSQFKTKVDNSSAPFIPKIFVKPNAQVPLPESLININQKNDGSDPSRAISLMINAARHSRQVDPQIYEHPYQYELENFRPEEWQLQRAEPIMYNEMTPLDVSQVVETVEQLNNVLEELKSAKEIAIDVEHHSYRSYLGITCLIQVSTRTKDYIIDSIALRDDLYVLNEVFTDPKIVKVLHGASSDIVWLQRDLGLYIVNMFDTGLAALELGLHNSLKFLLSHYCNLEVSKEHQTADWRIRPLDQQLISYAQGDTHYLLYVYDLMRNELLEAGSNNQILASVINASKEVCLRRFTKPQLEHDSHQNILFRYNRNPKKARKRFNTRQLAALKGLYAWRDGIARREDESCGYVLPNHMLLQIAESLPRDSQGVLALCNPCPPLVRQHQLEIHAIIVDAVANPAEFLNSSEVVDLTNANDSTVVNSSNRNKYKSRCPHDTRNDKKEETSSSEKCDLRQLISRRTSDSVLFPSTSEPVVRDDAKQREKLIKIQRQIWDPLVLFMPGKSESNVAGSDATDDDNGVDDTTTPSLREMLSGAFKWKIPKPKRIAPAPAAPKSFGTKIDIDPTHHKSTSEMVDQLIKSKRQETSLHVGFGGGGGGNLSWRGGRGGQKRGNNSPGGRGSHKKPRHSEPFRPHQYKKNDFRRFERKGPNK